MKEKIEKKIEAIIDYIVAKPESKLTKEDYDILSSELREIRFREQSASNAKRLSDLIAITTSAGLGSIT